MATLASMLVASMPAADKSLETKIRRMTVLLLDAGGL
jgi:hypothetical protein